MDFSGSIPLDGRRTIYSPEGRADVNTQADGGIRLTLKAQQQDTRYAYDARSKQMRTTSSAQSLRHDLSDLHRVQGSTLAQIVTGDD